jgi:hypothetical protein
MKAEIIPEHNESCPKAIAHGVELNEATIDLVD